MRNITLISMGTALDVLSFLSNTTDDQADIDALERVRSMVSLHQLSMRVGLEQAMQPAERNYHNDRIEEG